MRVLTSDTRASGTAPLSYRDQLLVVLFGLWMVIGLFVDGWAHDNNKPETFFTPWHGILYSGFAAAAAYSLDIVRRRRVPGRPLREALPVGHGVSLVALAVFAAGGVGDLVWHELLGIEVGVEALLSPTHLVLLAAGLVALGAPVRLAWATSDRDPGTLRRFLPVVLSVTLAVALVGFFLLYLSPFVNDAAGSRFARAPGQVHEHPSSDAAELQQMLGIGSILMTTVLFSVPILAILRRWRPPAGTFTLMLGLVTFLFVGLDEFAQAPLVLTGVLAGAAADVLVSRIPTWAVAAAATVVMWLSYFALYGLTEGGVAWTAELWAGSVFLAGLIALALGALVAPLPAGSGSGRHEPAAVVGSS